MVLYHKRAIPQTPRIAHHTGRSPGLTWENPMRVLLVHPSALMYSEIYLRLEPLGLERIAAAIRSAGHEVRLLDLQIFRHADYRRELAEFVPDAVGFSLNYLANVPEVIDLAIATKDAHPRCFLFAGGHSASF